MRAAGRSAAALSIAFAIASGCASVLGIDGDYGDQTESDASHVEPDASGGSSGSSGSSGSGGTAGSTGDATNDDRGVTDVVTETPKPPCTTPTGACMNSLPSGWELVLFKADRSAACPTDFTSQDVISAPVAGTGACGCSCSVTNADCSTGSMATKYDTTNACGNVGASLNITGADQCSRFNGNLSDWFSATPLPASVTCSATSSSDKSKVTSTAMRACQVPTACREEVCNGDGPPDFLPCIVNDGDVACPSGWNTKTLVGTDVDLSCSNCTCQGTATCSNGSLRFYADSSCTEPPFVTFDINDVCQESGPMHRIGGMKYTATAANQQCSADGPKTASVDLSGVRSVCCK